MWAQDHSSTQGSYSSAYPLQDNIPLEIANGWACATVNPLISIPSFWGLRTSNEYWGFPKLDKDFTEFVGTQILIVTLNPI